MLPLDGGADFSSDESAGADPERSGASHVKYLLADDATLYQMPDAILSIIIDCLTPREVAGAGGAGGARRARAAGAGATAPRRRGGRGPRRRAAPPRAQRDLWIVSHLWIVRSAPVDRFSPWRRGAARVGGGGAARVCWDLEAR
jgi:hypothetical protein